MDMDMDQDDYGCLYLPPGFRFHPMDEEIITCYLWEKVMDGSFCARAITEIDLNKNEPWDLPSKAKMGEKEWYFFCKRDRKYPTGMRTNRATEAGYWKATGKDKEIYKGDDGNLVGMKKTLVFYLGRAPKGKKTNWVMHEYRLDGVCSYQSFNSTPSQEEWVVCRVFHKKVEAKGNSDEASGRATSFSDNAFLVDELLDYCSPGLPRLVDAPSSVISTAGHDLAAVGFNFDHANSPFAAAAAATMSHCAPNTSFPRPNHMATGRRNVYHNTLHQGGASFGPSHSQLGTGCGTVDDKKAAEICSTGEEVNGNQYYNDLEVLWKC